jgi:hypothetical protein
MTGGGANLGGNLEATYFPADKDGWIDINHLRGEPGFDQSFLEDGTTAPSPRLLRAPYLVRLRSAAGAAAGQTFNYAVANRPYYDLMQVSEAAPATQTNHTLAAGYFALFLVRSNTLVNISTANTTFDAAINWLAIGDARTRTVNAVAGAGNETMLGVPARTGYVAFTIENLGATSGTFDVTVTTLDPKPFTEICPSWGGNGKQLGTTSNELLAVQALGFDFSLYGANVSSYKVSTNGWLTFDTATTGNPQFRALFPSTDAPNAVVAAYWTSLNSVVCSRNDADRTIIEWHGAAFVAGTFPTVEAQVSIYKAGNRIEWAYGPNHQGDGTNASAGVENASGTVGFQLFADEPGAVTPGYAEAIVLP